ncbi:hypothetical protein CPB86DRAFT_359024 [Serendipita vermifera]|nr:hypothetical protein CPB86DRAFT_359024 [Serendipita vermifera]
MSSSTAPPASAAAAASSAAVANTTTASRNRHASVDALSEMDEGDDILVDQQTLDRHDRASASPSAQPPSNGNTAASVLVQPSMQSPRSTTTTTRASPYESVKWNKSPRYSPYPLSTSPDSRTTTTTTSTLVGRQYDPMLRASAPIDIHRSHQYRNQPSQYQYGHHQPMIAHHRPIAPQHRHHLSTETDADSIGYLSPGMSSSATLSHLSNSTNSATILTASRLPHPPLHVPNSNHLTMLTDLRHSPLLLSLGYPHRSVPAPSVSSSSETSDEDELEEDELIEQDQEDEPEGIRFNQVGSYSPRTPAYLTSSLPSPRVMHAPSSSIPKSSTATGLTLPPISSLGVGFGGSPLLPPPKKSNNHHHHHHHTSMSLSPFRNPITLPTETGGTYTVEPLPVIVGPQPNRDSTWRWKYYDKVSSMRHTLSDRLFHSDPAKVSSSSSSITRTAPHPSQPANNMNIASSVRKEESDDEELPFSDGPSPIPSPRVRNNAALQESSSRGVLERIGLLGGASGGKKQFFATPAKYSDYTGVLSSANDAL